MRQCTTNVPQNPADGSLHECFSSASPPMYPLRLLKDAVAAVETHCRHLRRLNMEGIPQVRSRVAGSVAGCVCALPVVREEKPTCQMLKQIYIC